MAAFEKIYLHSFKTLYQRGFSNRRLKFAASKAFR